MLLFNYFILMISHLCAFFLPQSGLGLFKPHRCVKILLNGENFSHPFPLHSRARVVREMSYKGVLRKVLETIQ